MNPFSYSHLDNGALLRRLADAVAHECTSTADVIALIAEVDERCLYLEQAYDSMFAYCVGKLRLSDEAAYKRIHAARTARRFPAVFVALAEGRLHLSAVVMLGSHLTPENAEELLAAATHQTKAAIEQLLAERFPRPALPTRIQALPRLAAADPHAPARVKELQLAPGRVEPSPPRDRVVPLSPEHLGLQVTIHRDTYEVLRYVQALLGHQVPSGDVAQVLHRSLVSYAAELEKQKFAATRRPRAARPGSSADPRHIPASVKRAVWERDGGQCGFVSEAGQRCAARSRLQFDHIDPVARGGEATVENIRLRCRAHNLYEAECVFGAGFMENKREAARQAAAAARDEKARVQTPAVDPSKDVTPWLRRLGYRGRELREAAEFCATMPDASLEERVRAAIRFLHARGRAA